MLSGSVIGAPFVAKASAIKHQENFHINICLTKLIMDAVDVNRIWKILIMAKMRLKSKRICFAVELFLRSFFGRFGFLCLCFSCGFLLAGYETDLPQTTL